VFDLQQHLKKQASLRKRRALLYEEQRAHALEVIQLLMEELQLTFSDIADAPKRKPTAAKQPSSSAKIKFRDSEGHEWSGRGLKPKWLKQALESGKTLEDFRV